MNEAARSEFKMLKSAKVPPFLREISDLAVKFADAKAHGEKTADVCNGLLKLKKKARRLGIAGNDLVSYWSSSCALFDAFHQIPPFNLREINELRRAQSIAFEAIHLKALCSDLQRGDLSPKIAQSLEFYKNQTIRALERLEAENVEN